MTNGPRLYVYIMKQDDPKKCTSAKMVRLNLASPIYRASRLPKGSLILNPYCQEVLTQLDRDRAEKSGILAIDCSWENVGKVFDRGFRGVNRRLPLLLAANPTSYSRVTRLSSLEALAASLFIFRFDEKAKQLLSIFKWGTTFYTLNKAPLKDYRNANSSDEIKKIEREYFST